MTFHDIRLALRSLAHDRSVSAIVILCLALGIGINAALFSVIDGVLIQPLPFPQADRLVVLNEVSETARHSRGRRFVPGDAGHSGAGQVAIHRGRQ
jgi:hypothetical protein